MIKAILIDDEPESLNSLSHDLRTHCPEIEIIGQYDNGKDAIKGIHTLQPDVLFLDIDMPYINGFDLLEMVPDTSFEVVFTTAHDQYAIQAFRISAIDYLLKPIDKDLLISAVKKVSEGKTKRDSPRQIKFLIQQLKDLETNNVKKIALPTIDGVEFIDMKDILYCKSDGAYSHIFLLDGSRLYISKTLRFLEDALSEYHFYRVHNSYIVNLNYVKKYSRSDGGLLTLSNGKEVRVSRTRKNELLDLL